MDDYEVPDAAVKALRALSNKEEPPCKVNTTAPNADAAVTMAAPAATLAEETSTTQADANSCPPGPCSPASTSAAMSSLSDAETACSAAEFDYSGLDAQTVTDLHLAEQTYTSGRKLAEMGLRRMADGVSIAHDALCGELRQFVASSQQSRRSCPKLGQLKTWEPRRGYIPPVGARVYGVSKSAPTVCCKLPLCLITAVQNSRKSLIRFPLLYYMLPPSHPPPPIWCRPSNPATLPPTSNTRIC